MFLSSQTVAVLGVLLKALLHVPSRLPENKWNCQHSATIHAKS
jgi:hypothetical protein